LSVAFPKYLLIHGHFYQPPRENPWLEAVEIQDSAAPYHDWNERITRECYAPNTRSRLVDGSGKILAIINNYAWMSFNFGATLLGWMEEAAPDVLKGIVEGDRLSRERRGGHGNAMAQVYNHIIMPLASPHDKKTQVLWGMADFRKRFGREAEGMWLAETAADVASLEALAAAGIKFTVLAPRQAKRWRRLGTDPWEDGGGIDPSRAYLCRLPSGKSINLFFYDGNISQQVAFERLLDSGEKFLGRLMNGISDARQHAQLMHIATDGESYGHHHAHGDMALAYVLNKLGQGGDVRLTNYGEFLELHPPEWEAEVHDNSSWSCVHGVERWRSNCGCNSGTHWHQEWRAPLREAFDFLKGKIDEVFEKRGKEYLRDPWEARNAFIDVLLDRSEPAIRQFFEKYGTPGMDDAKIRHGLRLLEMQRHGLLMYTSCGWFFDEISGLETTQCLRYAARALQLARHYGADVEDNFVKLLEKAPSNLPEVKHGRNVWKKYIVPSRVELERVLAHHAMNLIYTEPQPTARVYSYDVEAIDQQVQTQGPSHLAVGRLQMRSRLTWSTAETSFVVIHYGGLDFHAVLRPTRSPELYEAFKHEVLRAFASGSLADLTELVLHEFQGESYRLDDLFTEERRRVIGIILQDRFEEYQRALGQLGGQDEGVLNSLGRLHYPIPRTMRTAGSVYLDAQLQQELLRLESAEALTRIKQLAERSRTWGHVPDGVVLGKLLTEELHVVLSELNPASDLQALVERAGRILDAAFLLGISLDTWRPQNQLLDAYAHLAEQGEMAQPLRQAFGLLADKLGISPDLLGWRP